MIGRIISIGLFLLLFILLVGAYLSPDDLVQCDGGRPDVKSAQCQPVDAIVAISGGDTQARTREAIELYKQGWAPKIVFSGAAADPQSPSNAEMMMRQAIDAGVPAEQIVIEESSKTTKQNADFSAQLLREDEINRVILVTSSYHQRRAGLEFRKRVGGDIVVLNHPVERDGQWSYMWWLTPTGWYLATGEMVKIVAFYINGVRQ